MRVAVALLLAALALAFNTGYEYLYKNRRSPTPSGVHIKRAEFGLFMLEGGKATFRPSKEVPLSVGQAYGWIVTLQAKQEKITWAEELTLPSAPITWGNPPTSSKEISREVSADRKTSVLVREVTPKDGRIFHSWAVAEGDPPGRYTIRLLVADADPIVFEFEVQ